MSSSPLKIVLNFRGNKFEVLVRHLEHLPSTCRLFRLVESIKDFHSKKNAKNTASLANFMEVCDDWNLVTNEFFFNRDESIVSMMLDYTNSGKFHFHDNSICINKIFDEFEYWGIDEHDIQPCCYLSLYKRKHLIDDLLEKREKVLNSEEFNRDNQLSSKVRFSKRLWNFLEHRTSSRYASLYHIFSITMILLSTVDLILRTIPELNDLKEFDYIEIGCIIWFTAEWSLRLIASPKKIEFFVNFLNITDLFSIVPFYIYFALNESELMEVIKNVARLFRTFSIIRVVIHSGSVKTLTYTLTSSFKEIIAYLLYLCICILLFSSFVYYAENDIQETRFSSIPETFW